MSSSNTTTSLSVIRKWVEERDGKPSIVKDSNLRGRGLLRIYFPGVQGDESLELIPWDEWYDIFRENRFAFLYRDRALDGEMSRYFKLVKRN